MSRHAHNGIQHSSLHVPHRVLRIRFESHSLQGKAEGGGSGAVRPVLLGRSVLPMLRVRSAHRHIEALASKIGTISLEAQSKIEKDTAKKEAKAEAKAEAALKKKLASQVTIKRIERTKRKHVTAIHGLEAFSIDLKKAAKQLAGRFATGASVTKNAQGFDEIVVQGDVADDILEILEKGEGVLKGVPVANVEIVEDKKKKGPE